MKSKETTYLAKRRQISILSGIMIVLLLQSCSADICSEYCKGDKCSVDCYNKEGKLISKIRENDVTIKSCSYDPASGVFSYSSSFKQSNKIATYQDCYARGGDSDFILYSGSKTKEYQYETTYVGNILYMTKYVDSNKDTRITYRWRKSGWILDNIVLNKFFQAYNMVIPVKFYDYEGSLPQSAKMLTYPFNEYSWTGEDFIITKFGR